MIKTQYMMLNETGMRLISESRNYTKVAEIEKMINMGMKLMEEARTIMELQKRNSVVLFMEFCAHVGISPNYVVFLEFCTRNNLDMYSETDFKEYTGEGLLPART